MQTISRERAAGLVKSARATVLKNAEVPDPPRSAAQFAFATLYQALFDNILASGRSNVAVTYRDLALLASQRREGKKIMASSLRKPFSQMLWSGALLAEPFANDGVSLSVELEPAGRRGRPLTLRAQFSVNGKAVLIEGANPNGEQPILREVHLAVERQAIQRMQANIARHFVDRLRETGFDRADDLSRWFARHGLHIPPNLVIALLIIFVLATTAGAAYVVIRYVVAHGLVHLMTEPNQQGQPPPGYHSRGAPSDTTFFPGGRLEARVTREARILTAIIDDLPFKRQFPDSNFSFHWILSVNGRRIERETSTPEIAAPLSTTMATLSSAEQCKYGANFNRPEGKPPEALDQQGHVIARGNHIIDNDLARGWLAGVATVPPLLCYSSARHSPISAIQMPNKQLRFIVRHGPVRASETVLKMSFGDGSVWTSAEQPWRPSSSGEGDAWDRWQTILDHGYQQNGKYEVRFVLYRSVDGILSVLRETMGSVYVGVPPPQEAPVGQRPGLSKFSLDSDPTGSGAAMASGRVSLPGIQLNTFLTVQGSKGKFVAPQMVVSMLNADPFWVAFGVIPPTVLSQSPRRFAIDFGDGTPPEELGGRTKYAQGTFFETGHEYLHSGTYPITIAALGEDNHLESVELRRHVHVFADASPTISE